jgi:hypothetical protein
VNIINRFFVCHGRLLYPGCGDPPYAALLQRRWVVRRCRRLAVLTALGEDASWPRGTSDGFLCCRVSAWLAPVVFVFPLWVIVPYLWCPMQIGTLICTTSENICCDLFFVCLLNQNIFFIQRSPFLVPHPNQPFVLADSVVAHRHTLAPCAANDDALIPWPILAPSLTRRSAVAQCPFECATMFGWGCNKPSCSRLSCTYAFVSSHELSAMLLSLHVRVYASAGVACRQFLSV